MSRNRRGNRPNWQNKNRQKTEPLEELNDSPVVACFREYAKELDDKHDRYERIVKIGRDITIESKRIIFLLHTIDPKKNNREKVLEEAEKRLRTVFETNFLQIARELDGLDQNQYSRGFSAGLQEFIEAHSFYEYQKGSTKLSDWDNLQEHLKYTVDDESPPPPKTENPEKDAVAVPSEEADKAAIKKEVTCIIKPMEFMLGLSDAGGELMRRAINSLGSGDMDSCFHACKTLQALYAGYLRLGYTGNREMSRKISTLRQSTLKVENVCYNVKVRGGESAFYDTLDAGGFASHGDEDEGFY